MKKLLLWNGILSIINSIAITALFIFIFDNSSKFTGILNNELTLSSVVNDLLNDKMKLIQILSIYGVLAIFGIISLIMGIITLAKSRESENKGLVIVSGVLAILGGIFFINAIVSFVAYRKEY